MVQKVLREQEQEEQEEQEQNAHAQTKRGEQKEAEARAASSMLLLCWPSDAISPSSSYAWVRSTTLSIPNFSEFFPCHHLGGQYIYIYIIEKRLNKP